MNTAEDQICCQDFHGLSFTPLVLFFFPINMKANLMIQVVFFHKYIILKCKA